LGAPESAFRGAGSIRRSAVSSPSVRRFAGSERLRPNPSQADGVGRSFLIAVANPSPAFSEHPALLLLPYSVGVGSKQEEPSAEVREARFGRAKHIPFCIEPCAGQVPEYDGESLFRDLGAVLQEDVGRSNVANDLDDARPQPAGIGDACTRACL
jgi:hypothetical protein